MDNYSIGDIETVKTEGNMSYREAVAILDQYDGDVNAAINDIKRHNEKIAAEKTNVESEQDIMQAKPENNEPVQGENVINQPKNEAIGSNSVLRLPKWCPLKYVSVDNWALAVLPIFGLVLGGNDIFVSLILSIVGLYVKKKWPYAAIAIINAIMMLIIHRSTMEAFFNFNQVSWVPNAVLAALAGMAVYQINKLGIKAFDKDASV